MFAQGYNKRTCQQVCPQGVRHEVSASIFSVFATALSRDIWNLMKLDEVLLGRAHTVFLFICYHFLLLKLTKDYSTK